MAATIMTTESLTAELLGTNSNPENLQAKVVVYTELLNTGRRYFLTVYDIPGDRSCFEKSIGNALGYIVNSPDNLCNELFSAIENSKGAVRFAGSKHIDFSSKSPYTEVKKDADDIARLALQVELALKEFV